MELIRQFLPEKELMSVTGCDVYMDIKSIVNVPSFLNCILYFQAKLTTVCITAIPSLDKD